MAKALSAAALESLPRTLTNLPGLVHHEGAAQLVPQSREIAPDPCRHKTAPMGNLRIHDACEPWSLESKPKLDPSVTTTPAEAVCV